MTSVPVVVRVWFAGHVTRWSAGYAVAGGPAAMSTLIAQFDPFQAAPCVRLPAVDTLCELADLGFPALADLMSDPVRASVGAYRAEIRDAFTYSDCVGCTPQHMCAACDAEERRAMRLAERAYALTA